MKKITLIIIALYSSVASASVYDTPACYSKMPTSCSFNEMTLSLCNQEGIKNNIVFLLSQRIHVPGGNKFATANGERTCVVKGIKGTEPKRYQVGIGL